METNVSKINSIIYPEVTPPARAARGRKWKGTDEKIWKQCKGLLPVINHLFGPFKPEQYSPQQNTNTARACELVTLVLTGENIWFLILRPSSPAFAPFN